MRMVWKYEMEEPTAKFELPVGAQLVHVDHQIGTICLWFLVDTMKDERIERTFHAVPTGCEIPIHTSHIGSVVIQGEYGLTMVWHVFEEMAT